jgi:hypothetical protein
MRTLGKEKQVERIMKRVAKRQRRVNIEAEYAKGESSTLD